MEPNRPNPDELLSRVSEAAREHQRGRLKIFFGASPGTGKTFAMLEAARRLKAAGVDVVAGIVETHGRRETESLLEGLEILPRRVVEHRGITIGEFDLEGALRRKPQLLLVDELAHTNAPGSRHSKRWRDVMDLLDAGIDVYSTLNVQHLDSLNDVVAQITGVAVRETLPDSVLDQAAEIELVDIPMEELRKRLADGKVYVPDQAERAMAGFFRPGNLIALRELALRRTADRVDAQMRSYRRDHSIESTWPVTERLMVSIGPSPFSAKLIRAAKRMAERLGAEWIVAFVETPRHAAANEETRQRVQSALRLAGQLGAETVTLNGTDVAESLLSYARSRNVSRIVLGKQAGPLWRRILRGSVLDDLIARSGDIELIAISGEPENLDVPGGGSPTPPQAGHEWIAPAAVIGVATVVSVLLRESLNPVNLVMIHLVGVIAVAMRASRRAALFASCLSVAAFDFFCVPPYYTFAVADSEYLLTFAVMFTTGALISSLAGRIRLQAEHAAQREARTQALYRLTRELSGEAKWMEAGRRAGAIAADVFRAKTVIFFPEDGSRISFRRRTTEELPVPGSEEAIAQWVFDHGRRAGKGMDTLPGASALYVPLRGPHSVAGVMAIVPSRHTPAFDSDQLNLIEAFATQTALAIDRAQSAARAREAELMAETEQMRAGLLSSVSHDLRTPLAAITGAASSLRSQWRQLREETRQELLESIEQEADRLGRLVNNLLEMTRLEAGRVVVKRDWHSIEEIAGAALQRLDRILQGRPVKTDFPPDLMAPCDDVLLEQVFWNILENACKYSPPGSPLSLSAREENEGVVIDIADTGPGFAPGEEKRVWEKFYRGGADGRRGAGLGLTICRAIIQAHGGRVEARNGVSGGALIRIWLPREGQPPEVPAA